MCFENSAGHVTTAISCKMCQQLVKSNDSVDLSGLHDVCV